MRTALASAACLLAATLASSGAWARTDTCYLGGPLLPNYTINGNGTLSGTDILVTPDLQNQLASVIFNPTFSTLGDLHVKMVVKITTTTGTGADGMAFVMHNDPRGILAIGSPGEGIGYGVQTTTPPNNVAITPSVAVEFDTYYNAGRADPNHPNDLNYGHIGLMFNGNPTHDGIPAHIKDLNGTGITLKTGNPVYLWIDYAVATTTLDVYVSATNTKPGAPAMTAVTNLDTALNPTGHTFYMGFTGSTGGSQSRHEVLEFYASDTVADPTSSCCATNADCVGSPTGPVCDPEKRTCGQCTSLDVTRCSAPAGCNLVPANNVCVAACDGDYGSATTHPCASPNFPSCTFSGPGAGTCRVCDGDNGSGTTSACPTATPYCSATGFCGFCSTDSDCTAAGPAHTGAQCNPATGRCVQCVSGADCANPTPVCNAAGTCVACANDLGGATPACWNPNAPACVAGSCRQCSATNASLCSGTLPACNTTTNTCTACVNDRGGATPACPLASQPLCSGGLCVQCTSNANCSGPTPVCAGGTCVACDGDYGSGTGRACPTSGAPACSAGACYACSATNTTACSGTTPACNTTTHACAACNGDFGSAATQACADAQLPACLPTGACAQCRTNAAASTYYVRALAATNVGADGTTTLTALADNVGVTGGSSNQNRGMTNATAPTGTTRYRIGEAANDTRVNQEFLRAYSPAYPVATAISASASVHADFTVRSHAGTPAVTAQAWLYEYSDATGFVGGAKGTASYTGVATTDNSLQTMAVNFDNAAFTVAAGNRLAVVYGFTFTTCRPAYLWGQAASATPSGYQSFSVTESNVQACPSGACTASNTCAAPCTSDFGGAGTPCPTAALPACVSGACVPCSATNATACTAAQVCDAVLNKCVQCTEADASKCTGATPICNAATDTCVACNGGYGSASTFACKGASAPVCSAGACVPCASDLGGAAPACSLATAPACVSGACLQCSATATSACTATTPACDATAHLCSACNGSFGSGTSLACLVSTAPVCLASGACAPCTGDFGGPAGSCTSATMPACLSTGACAQCSATDTALCAGATPICDEATATCVACDGSYASGAAHACADYARPLCVSGACVQCSSSVDCANPTPVCEATTHACLACNGDDGTSASRACSAAAPTCASTGCKACTASSDCTFAGADHAGAVCNTITGRCVQCTVDGDCGAAQWCNANACVAKIANGGAIPGTCAALGARACLSGVCETADDLCGFDNAPKSTSLCSGDASKCRSGKCDPTDGLCGLTNGQGTCAVASQATDCRGGACDAASLKCGAGNGAACTLAGECSSLQCVDGYCCNGGCTGQCEACNVTGNLGVCSPFTGAPRGTRTACAGGTSTCAGQCEPTERTACTYPTSQCVAPSCDAASGVETLASSCDGAGACPTAATAPCSPYLCGAAACLTACTSTAECAAGFWCDATGHCVAKLLVGDPCAVADACPGNRCVDGYCCSAACPGQCEACDVAGLEGTCSPVTGAPHPGHGACVTASAPCAGACDGTLTTACTYPTAATACVAPTCSAGVATSGACDAAGGCTTSTTPCSPFVCDAAACKAACAADGDCAEGFWCDAPNCVAKTADGKSCVEGRECASGHCVDGLCCDTACAGQCEACDLPSNKGACTAVLGAPRGGRPACGGSGACAGTCDGFQTLSCAFPDESVVCRAGSCAADVATLPAGCDGAGACPAVQTVSCAPYHCGASQCVGDCAVDSDCAAASYCAGGVCKPRLADGAPCALDAQCASGHCADGVCCDTACTGQCEACDLATKVGVCSPAAGAPVGGRVACASDGSACGGACDGAERLACSYPAAETSCRAASCASGVATLPAACDGAGACPLPQTVACAPHACSGDACGGGGCAVDSDCPATAFCAAGVCQPKLDDGKPCSLAAQCKSTHCVDSVCCDSVCGGQCEACNTAGKLGTCSPVTGAPRGARTPCADDGTVCAGACDGATTTSCAYPGASVECRPASCAFGVAVLPAACDALGSCPPLSVRVCDPAACAGAICSGGCADDGECASGYFCSAGKCEPKKPVGQGCGRDEECAGGLCVDGFCCNRACGAQCEACDVSGSEGTCATVFGIPHGGRAACSGQGACQGRCDGTSAAACAYPGSETACADPACASGVYLDTSRCSGGGECTPGAATACASGACQGATCGCGNTPECPAGLVCLAGACVVEPPDAGVVPPDAAVVTPPDATVVVPPDAQLASPDAEVVALDAEVVLPDAQVAAPDATAVVPPDAAAPGPDASQPGPDAGAPDGAFGEGWALTGGCACGAGSGASPLALVGLALASVLLRRRRG